MNINGYQIREAIKRWNLNRDTAYSQFKDSLTYFEGEVKESPFKVSGRIELADLNIARLEEIQQQFNQIVKVMVGKEQMPIARAVKLVGGAGRMEKMWREASMPKKDRYSTHETMRNRDMLYAMSNINSQAAYEQYSNYSRLASDLRNAIAKGNSMEVPMESLNISTGEYEIMFGT